jgi:hypothetical protein
MVPPSHPLGGADGQREKDKAGKAKGQVEKV